MPAVSGRVVSSWSLQSCSVCAAPESASSAPRKWVSHRYPCFRAGKNTGASTSCSRGPEPTAWIACRGWGTLLRNVGSAPRRDVLPRRSLEYTFAVASSRRYGRTVAPTASRANSRANNARTSACDAPVRSHSELIARSSLSCSRTFGVGVFMGVSSIADGILSSVRSRGSVRWRTEPPRRCA